jgi:hypothetical protein
VAVRWNPPTEILQVTGQLTEQVSPVLPIDPAGRHALDAGGVHAVAVVTGAP